MPAAKNLPLFEVKWTRAAEIDLDTICTFVATVFSQEIADRVHEEILDAADQLAIFPHAGKKDEVLGKMQDNLRCIFKKHCRIVYEILEKEIRIVGVIDMRKNPFHWSI
jgi:plasmid stabilization system protein ParE